MTRFEWERWQTWYHILGTLLLLFWGIAAWVAPDWLVTQHLLPNLEVLRRSLHLR
jgi:hypothetical protein